MTDPRDRLVMSSYATSSDAVSSTDLHMKTRDTLARLREVHAMAVTRYNSVDAYLLSPERMRELLRAEAVESQRECELAETIPLLLAAARTGVAIPSETLDRIAPGLDHSWQAVAAFAAAFPVRIQAGEDGIPITRGVLESFHRPIPESGDDGDLNYDA